jgi:hypothetical protein
MEIFMSERELEIYFLDNVAASDTFANISSDLDGDIWKYGVMPPYIGAEVEDDSKFWYADMLKNRWQDLLFQEIIDKLEFVNPHIKKYQFKSMDVKAGGKTDGMNGEVHIDRTFNYNVEGDGYMTFCYFPNKEWKDEWGGELQFFDADGDVIASFFPKPNTCIVFDSNIPHQGFGPTPGSNVLRKFITYKTFVHKNWNR